jgi:hypothetical protein
MGSLIEQLTSMGVPRAVAQQAVEASSDAQTLDAALSFVVQGGARGPRAVPRDFGLGGPSLAGAHREFISGLTNFADMDDGSAGSDGPTLAAERHRALRRLIGAPSEPSAAASAASAPTAESDLAARKASVAEPHPLVPLPYAAASVTTEPGASDRGTSAGSRAAGAGGDDAAASGPYCTVSVLSGAATIDDKLKVSVRRRRWQL